MNTREILEKCARACGYEYECISHTHDPQDDQHTIRSTDGNMVDWNPHSHSLDCAEMCAQLMIDTTWGGDGTFVDASGYDNDGDFVYCQAEIKDHNNDKCAAWRHAACQVAAMMGERV